MESNLPPQRNYILRAILIILLILFIWGGVYLVRHRKSAQPVADDQNQVNIGDPSLNASVANQINYTKSFKLGTLEFFYPDNLTMRQELSGAVSLYHVLPYNHKDSCDFKGDEPILESVTDFYSAYKIYDKDILSSVKFDMGGNPMTSALKKESAYTIGTMNGYKIYRGIEGCGTYEYYLPISPVQTLVISRNLYAQTLGLNRDSVVLANIPGLITKGEEESTFNNILFSIKIPKGAEPKKFTTDKYSFSAPEEWIKESYSTDGKCVRESISLTGDGYESGRMIAIYPKNCFDPSLVSLDAKEITEKDGYYIIAIYKDFVGEVPTPIITLRDIYKKVIESFTLNTPNKTPSIPKEMSILKVYFGVLNDYSGCRIDDSSLVYRFVPKTSAIARASMNELLKGPTELEKAKHLWTGINSGVKLNLLSFGGITAYADFYLPPNSTFNVSNKGTCGVSMVKKQIENTLKQFPNVKNVFITVNGRSMESYIKI